VDLLTIHSTCGKDALKAAQLALTEGAAAVDKPSPKLIAITLLTSLNSRQLRMSCGDDFLLVCPGVRPKWADGGDQKRSMTPKAAFKAGADYLVIGRPITASDDPVATFARICEELG
jgi:orotidine-5'-phosphate decarboxylase